MALYTEPQNPSGTSPPPPPTPQSGPSRRSYQIAVLVALVVFVAVIAGGLVLLNSNKKSGTAVNTTTTVSPAGGSTTPTTASLSSVVASAYVSDTRAWMAVAATYPVDPTDPRIEASVTGAELSSIRTNLTGARLRGQVAVGVDQIKITATVTALTANTATVTACLVDNSRVITHSTGAVVSTGPGGPVPVTATMLLVDGTWKIATNIPGGPAC
jgi:polyisoprenoid-binding protein YceI